MDRTAAIAGARSATPAVSVVLCTRNRPGFAHDVVLSVLAGDVVPAEVVVVDQSDREQPELPGLGTKETVVRYLWRPARGLSLGRNTGIAAATGDVLVFLDDDILVPTDWLAKLLAALAAAGPTAVVTGRVLSGPAEVPGAFAPSLSLDEQAAVFCGRPGRDVLLPMNMALHRSAVEAVGPFDVRLGAGSPFPSSEDNDFGYRLLEAGFDIVYDPSLVVTHRAWRAPSALLPLRWAYGRGQGAYFVKHLSLRDRYMLERLARDVWRHVKRAPRRMLAEPREGLADLVYSLGVLTGACQWVVERPRP